MFYNNIKGLILMGFKKLVNRAKTKIVEVIDKGNEEIKKIKNTKDVFFYASPVIAGFEAKRAFYEDDKLYFPVNEFDKDLICLEAIIGLDDDKEYYMIIDVSEDTIIKEVKDGDKVYSYECYEVDYDILNDVFGDAVNNLPYYDLNDKQKQLLQEIKEKLDSKSIALKGRKNVCLDLWQYFVECIQYRLTDYTVVITFSRVATQYIDDFSTYLIKLFA